MLFICSKRDSSDSWSNATLTIQMCCVCVSVSVSVCACVCMCVRVCVCVCVCIYIYIHTYTHTYPNTHTNTCVPVSRGIAISHASAARRALCGLHGGETEGGGFIGANPGKPYEGIPFGPVSDLI
jgi:hypothetical protein